MTAAKKELSPKDKEALLTILEERFEENKPRHPNTQWKDILKKIEAAPDKLFSLNEMETTGGEPDVIQLGNHYFFIDCALETPSGRRNLCYDDEARKARKKNAPADSAMNMAKKMGIALLSEEQYQQLQQLGTFDTKTSSWIQTPAAIRSLGGALFADRRYNQVFIYHNGADSYYGSRGFRGILQI